MLHLHERPAKGPIYWEDWNRNKAQDLEGIEPVTYWLSNRCSAKLLQLPQPKTLTWTKERDKIRNKQIVSFLQKVDFSPKKRENFRHDKSRFIATWQFYLTTALMRFLLT